MADTIITNTPDKNGGDNSAGWIVALVLIIAAIVGGVILYQNGFFSGPAQKAEGDGTNINVVIPNPTTPQADESAP